MLRDLVARILHETIRRLVAEGRLPASAAEIVPEAQDPRNPEHGDFATNWALVASKPLQTAPRTLADGLAESLSSRREFTSVEVAGPGFVNLRLAPETPASLLPKVLELGATGLMRAMPEPHPRRINIEFVSVNPNGPITIGSGRGAAFGSTLANVLEAAGNTVWREYYVNDGVNSEQMRLFAESVRAVSLGRELPTNGYRGDYVQEVADRLRTRLEPTAIADTLTDAREKRVKSISLTEKVFWEKYLTVWERLSKLGLPKQILERSDVEDLQFALTGQMQILQREALDAFRVSFNLWFSEQTLHDNGNVAEDIAALEEKGVADDEPYRTKLRLGRNGKVEEVVREDQPNDEEDAEGERSTLWLRSTRFGDDMDRVLRRRDGRLTYIASDVSYHHNKFSRPPDADRLITVLGPDHHGYIGRLRAVVAAMLLRPEMTDEEALSIATARLQVVIFQLVRFMKDGAPAPMRKRDGNIYALSDLLAEIGRKVKPDAELAEQLASGTDVARFFYLMRSHDSTFDFDLDLAARQSEENPVFYVQYAHARIGSVVRRFSEEGFVPVTYAAEILSHPKEISLLKMILDAPAEVRRCAADYGVHRLTTYAIELARVFHAFYDECRVLQADQPELSSARLDLCRGTAIAIGGVLDLLGVSAPERMEKTPA